MNRKKSNGQAKSSPAVKKANFPGWDPSMGVVPAEIPCAAIQTLMAMKKAKH